jgi:hypothetical protein
VTTQPTRAVAHRERDTGRGRSPGDLARIFHGVGDRLVGVHRLAGIDALEDHALVRVVGCGDQHAFDLGIGQQFVECGGGPTDPVLLLELGTAFG